mmetsp:Transcript_42015/g.116020  ORF Transcript_42015/g.116020 Transcript_42015/m.116020 type:complete len:307 (+) Transcript_42015:1168-2088(+)
MQVILARRTPAVGRVQLDHLDVVRGAVAAAGDREPVVVRIVQVAEDGRVGDRRLIHVPVRGLQPQRCVVRRDRHEREVADVLGQPELDVLALQSRPAGGSGPGKPPLVLGVGNLEVMGSSKLAPVTTRRCGRGDGAHAMEDPLVRTDLASHKVAHVRELPTHLDGQCLEALRRLATVHAQVVRALVDVLRIQPHRKDVVVRHRRHTLGVPVERDGGLVQVERDRVVVADAAEQLHLEEQVVERIDHRCGHLEVEVKPAARRAAADLERVDPKRLVRQARGVRVVAVVEMQPLARRARRQDRHRDLV